MRARRRRLIDGTLTVVGVGEEAFGVVAEVGAGLAGVQFWWGYPFHQPVADLDGPAVFGEAVIGPADEDFLVDVGLPWRFARSTDEKPQFVTPETQVTQGNYPSP